METNVLRITEKLQCVYSEALSIIGNAAKMQPALELSGTPDDLVLIVDTDYTDNDEVYPVKLDGEQLICKGVESGEQETINVLDLGLWELTSLADHIQNLIGYENVQPDSTIGYSMRRF